MKFSKLALASVAAFGLAGVAQADGTYYVQENLELWGTLNGTTDYEMPQTGANEYGKDDSSGAVWFGAATEIGDTAVLTYDGNKPTGNFPTVNGVVPEGDVGSKYLKVSNSSTLWRVLKPYAYETKPESFGDLVANDQDDPSMDVEVGEGLFVDTLVQFTPSEDPPTPEEGSKLIVWMNVNSNLCVTASKITVYTPEESEDPIAEFANANFETGKELKTNTWYRLTVKAYSTVLDDGGGTVKHGFKVYIDGTAVASAAAAVETNGDFVDAMGEFAGSEALEADFNAGKLFLSLSSAEAATLAAVGFKGEGLVDDIVISNVDPITEEAPAGGIDFTLTWGEGVSAVWYAIGGGEFVEAENGVSIRLAEGKTIEFDADPKAWYTIDAASIPAQADLEDGETYEITATAATSAAAAGVEDENLAGWTPAQVKAAFGDEITPDALNDATAPYLDYQLGQTLGTIKGEPALKIVDIAESKTAGAWDIKVQVLDGATPIAIDDGDEKQTTPLRAALKVIAADTLEGFATAEAKTYDLIFDEETTDLTVTVDEGAFFKATIEYIGAPVTELE